MIVAIDGPAGAGKSTIATAVAKALGFQLIDTGAMYRVVAKRALELGLDQNDGPAIAHLAANLRFDFSFAEDGKHVVRCNDDVVGNEIRSPEVGSAASVVSAHPEVREALLNVQRELGLNASCVMEGRDIGTVIFPTAEVKIFLTATPQARAQRRVDQMKLAGEDSEFSEVYDDLVARDRRDSDRQIAPLVKADDALEIDSTRYSVEEVVEQILEFAQASS